MEFQRSLPFTSFRYSCASSRLATCNSTFEALCRSSLSRSSLALYSAHRCSAGGARLFTNVRWSIDIGPAYRTCHARGSDLWTHLWTARRSRRLPSQRSKILGVGSGECSGSDNAWVSLRRLDTDALPGRVSARRQQGGIHGRNRNMCDHESPSAPGCDPRGNGFAGASHRPDRARRRRRKRCRLVDIAQRRSCRGRRRLFRSSLYIAAALPCPVGVALSTVHGAGVRPVLGEMVAYRMLDKEINARSAVVVGAATIASALATEFMGLHYIIGAFLVGAVPP